MIQEKMGDIRVFTYRRFSEGKLFLVSGFIENKFFLSLKNSSKRSYLTGG